MGMYDYLGKVQIKCFYRPVISHFINDPLFPNQERVTSLDMWASMGNLRKYRHFDKVPYKTMWYDYGKNFMIFDALDVEGSGLVHIIRGGRYIWSVHYSKLNTSIFPITLVVDKVGDTLNITSKDQFPLLIQETKEMCNIQNAHTKEFWKKRDGLEERDPEIYKKLAIELDNIAEDYKKKWYIQDSDVQKGWFVGGFLYGLYTFCESDEMAKQFVGFFTDSLSDNKESIENILNNYAAWCMRHDIPIYHSDLWNFFFNFTTSRNLNEIVTNSMK